MGPIIASLYNLVEEWDPEDLVYHRTTLIDLKNVTKKSIPLNRLLQRSSIDAARYSFKQKDVDMFGLMLYVLQSMSETSWGRFNTEMYRNYAKNTSIWTIFIKCDMSSTISIRLDVRYYLLGSFDAEKFSSHRQQVSNYWPNLICVCSSCTLLKSKDEVDWN